MRSDFERAAAYVRERRGDLQALLQDLIRFRSVNPDLDPTSPREGDIQRYVAGYLDPEAVAVDLWEPDPAALEKYRGEPGYHAGKEYRDRPIVTLRRRGTGGGPSLLFLCHVDVVPAEEAAWQVPPFAGEVRDGRVIGRGAVDMKGGLAAALFALRTLAALGLELPGDVLLASVPDEEAGGTGTLLLLDHGVRADAAVLPEPTDLTLAPLCRGILWGTIRVEGRSGHIEMPQPPPEAGGAVDAVAKAEAILSRFARANEAWANDPRKNHPLLRLPNQIRVAAVHAGSYHTSYAESAELRVNVQYLPAERDEHRRGGKVAAEVEALVREVAAADPWLRGHPPKVDWVVDADCAETPVDHPFVQSCQEALVQAGLPVRVEGIHSHTDMGLLVNAGIPTVNFGPGSPYLAHQDNEWLALEDLERATLGMLAMALTWCGGAIP